MPVYTFIAENEAVVPVGYLQRATVSVRQVQNFYDNSGQLRGPESLAFAMLQNNRIPLVPGINYKTFKISPDAAPQGDAILTAQYAQPTAERVQVNAPYADPVGNRGQNQVPLPREGDKTRIVPLGDLEPLPDDALPTTGGDGLYGEMDGFGGTYEDISPTTGIVSRRPRGDERVIPHNPMQHLGQR